MSHFTNIEEIRLPSYAFGVKPSTTPVLSCLIYKPGVCLYTSKLLS